MSDHETRLTALEAARKEIEEALVAMAHLETKQSNLIREQAEYMANHEERLKSAERQAAAQRELNRDTDKRIADLVSAIGAFIQRKQ
jgi:hypothetical protein